MESEYHYKIKTCLIGESNAGKTSIVNRLINDCYYNMTPVTIGVDYSTHNLTIDNNHFQFTIWDCSGAERFMSIIRSYYDKTIGIIIVYDISDPNAFENIQKWYDQFNNVKQYQQCQYFTGIIVGNKTDKKTDKNNLNQSNVAKEKILKYADQIGFGYIETSAKTGENVDQIYKLLGQQILKDNNPEIIDNHLIITHTQARNTFNSSETTYKPTNLTYPFKCCHFL